APVRPEPSPIPSVSPSRGGVRATRSLHLFGPCASFFTKNCRPVRATARPRNRRPALPSPESVIPTQHIIRPGQTRLEHLLPNLHPRGEEENRPRHVGGNRWEDRAGRRTGRRAPGGGAVGRRTPARHWVVGSLSRPPRFPIL